MTEIQQQCLRTPSLMLGPLATFIAQLSVDPSPYVAQLAPVRPDFFQSDENIMCHGNVPSPNRVPKNLPGTLLGLTIYCAYFLTDRIREVDDGHSSFRLSESRTYSHHTMHRLCCTPRVRAGLHHSGRPSAACFKILDFC